MVYAVSRAIRATACSNCRVSLLRSFTSIAGVRWHSNATARRTWRKAPVAGQTIRFSSSSADSSSKLVDEASKAIKVAETTQKDSQFTELTGQHELASPEAIVGAEATPGETPIADGAAIVGAEATPEETPIADGAAVETESSSTPWYLQVDTPSTHIPTMSKRQIIPDLPSSPPPILQPLLQRISIDLGLDDLALLDLRGLDPPPALGSNLIMIIGTARSEKHLHVSADRLCRWLRTEYKLRPDADGLLGRNELKLKLKRKAKRAKLMGSTPNEDDADDGVRTGWVCVDVGSVEPGKSEIAELEEKESGFVGFGRHTDETKIVVQMLVEEKRVELDLEKLWGGIVRRQSSGLPAEADIDGFMDQPEDHVGQSQAQDSTPVIKIHDAYAEPFPTTSSFSPVAIQPRGGRNASKVSE